MRAVIEGIDPPAAWSRYLRNECEIGQEHAARTLRWIREEFAIAARRHGRHGVARLVCIDPNQVPVPAVKRPSFEQFIAAKPDWEDFPIQMLQEAYQDAYDTDEDKAQHKRKRGIARLLRRQLEALSWLEQLEVRSPKPDDHVSDWLTSAVAERLEAFGIKTLFLLASRVNDMGPAWHIGIPAIGAGKAARIVAWLREHAGSIGVPIGGYVDKRRGSLSAADLQAIVPAATALVPLDKLVVPTELDGSAGTLRLPQERCLLAATNDYQAVQAWIASKRQGAPDEDLSPTQRAYRREAERLMLWAVLERQKPLSSLQTEDAQAFMRFLEDPPSSWCGPRFHQRWSPLWRPMEGPLEAPARAQSLTILRNLFSFLTSQGYMLGDPFSGVARPRVATRPAGEGRTLSFSLLDTLIAGLSRLEGPVGTRAQLAVHWLYATGLRRSELVQARCSNLKRVELTGEYGEPTDAWVLLVKGKGERYREVLVQESAIALLVAQLKELDLDPDPLAPSNAHVPIVGRSVEGSLVPLTAMRLYKTLKAAFERCAAELQLEDPKAAARLRNASTHWFRHTHASHSVNRRPGMPNVELHIAQQNLGHASIDTTARYVTADRDARLKAMKTWWETTAMGKQRA